MQQSVTNRLRQDHRVKEVGRESIVLTAFVDDPNRPFGLHVVVGHDPINLAEFK